MILWCMPTTTPLLLPIKSLNPRHRHHHPAPATHSHLSPQTPSHPRMFTTRSSRAGNLVPLPHLHGHLPNGHPSPAATPHTSHTPPPQASPPTSVDVDHWPQQVCDHAAALNVPARPANAPGGRPGGLPRLGRLPQGKVRRAALAAIHRHTLTRPSGCWLVER